ncbi:MAG TPA: cytochrome c peroxidase [Polyangiaceae bacterium]|nr:cytochrome c peroxidase [Polyangiaceae bacterium]
MSTRLPKIGVLICVTTIAACDEKSTPQATTGTPPASASAAPTVTKLTLPHDLGQVSIPQDNPQTEAKVKLGHQLFFEKRLSKDGSRACYSCHMNENGNGGKEPLAVGAEEKPLTRHSPVIWNVGYLGAFYWDGRSGSLEAQAIGAWSGGNMGVGKDNLDKKAKEIEKIADYKKQFDEVFPKEGVTPDTIAKAIAAYERTLICNETSYDKYAKGDEKALSKDQVQGLELFMGKAGCSVCHAAPHFSTAYGVKEGVYFNVGIGFKDKKDDDVDPGRKKVSEKDADWAAFKVPTLRNITKTAPYFHDGSVATLEEAVRFMASGGGKNKNLSPVLTDKKLTDPEVKSIVAFLGALDCGKTLEEPVLPK